MILLFHQVSIWLVAQIKFRSLRIWYPLEQNNCWRLTVLSKQVLIGTDLYWISAPTVEEFSQFICLLFHKFFWSLVINPYTYFTFTPPTPPPDQDSIKTFRFQKITTDFQVVHQSNFFKYKMKSCWELNFIWRIIKVFFFD